MHILENYGTATGAKVNKSKSILIRMGSLKGAQVPGTLAYLKTLGEGEFATILGVPFWEGLDNDAFWEKLYAKLKKEVATWKGITSLSLSIHGRTLLVNFIIYGTPRYWLSTSTPPAWFMEAIDSDVQTIPWDRSPRLQADELGSSQEGIKWITLPTYPRVGTREDGPLLGVGLLPMAEHTRALQAIWIARYLNPSTAEWKSVLDQWFSRTPLGRAAVFSKVDSRSLTASIRGNNTLPAFWKHACA